MNILLANNPREKYAIGEHHSGTLNNGMMESVAKLMPQIERYAAQTGLYPHLTEQHRRRQSIPSTPPLLSETTTANLAVVSSQMKGLMSKEGHSSADRQAQYHRR